MRKISYWAKRHKWQSRIIIISSFIVLNFLGIITGLLLTQLGIHISPEFVFGCFCFFLVALAAYPSKRKKEPIKSIKTFYVKQKSCDFLLAASTFCMLIYIGNKPESLFQYYPSLKATVTTVPSLPKDSSGIRYKSIKEFSASMKDERGNTLKWKERKNLLKQQVREIKKDNTLSPGTKTLLTILSVLVALGLLFVVAALSCNLSCSGSDGAALLLGVGGTVLVIFLLVITIRAIYGKKRKKKLASEKPITTG